VATRAAEAGGGKRAGPEIWGTELGVEMHTASVDDQAAGVEIRGLQEDGLTLGIVAGG